MPREREIMAIRDALPSGGSPAYLMDGTAFVYRSFYANRHLRRSDGFPTNALVLITRLLLRILREENPQFFLFALDGKGKNFRHDLYEKYKANREAMPEDLAAQLEPIKRMVGALGLCLEISGNCEADDCIASMAARFSTERPVVIISGDKDLKQCLSPSVFMWDPAAKEDKLLTMADFEAETGVPPARWPDVQALIGDSVDNIPGVPGIGPKTALEIFRICPSLEAIRDDFSKLSPKYQAKLEPYLHDIFLWRRLTRLKNDACPNLSLGDLSVRPINIDECEKLAREFEMTAVGREIANLIKARAPGGHDASTRQSEQVRPGLLPDPPLLPETSDASALPACYGRDVAVIPARDDALYIGVGEIGGDCQTEEFLWRGQPDALCGWLSCARSIVTDDLKHKMRMAYAWDNLVKTAGISKFEDLGLASYLLSPDESDYGWARISARWRETLDYPSAGPAAFALHMADTILKNLQAYRLLELYRTVEMPLVPVLAQMENIGFAIDPAAFSSFLNDVSGELDSITTAIYNETGEKFNLRSSRQLGQILFDKMGLSSGRKTKTGLPSTSELALEKLASRYPVVEKVLHFRKLDKILGTYLEPLPRLMDAHNRIHTTFNQEATATGRISSSNPNLQNIPVRGEMGQRMRGCFVPAQGHALIAADYSQIELRLLAHFSRDQNLLDAFRKGEDIHRRTASLMLEIEPELVSPDQRRLAKTINFGLLYGMGHRKLAQELRISDSDASAFIERYFARLAGLKDFYDKVLKGARENGYVTTLTGRRRWLPGITSANGQIAAQAQRQAVNAVTQGTAADIIKLAMIEVANDSELKNLGADLVLQVHDELLLEAPREKSRETLARVLEIMQGVKPGGTELAVPLIADGGIGDTWAQSH